MSLELGLVDEPSEPQLAFYHLQNEVAEKEEALRVATAKVGPSLLDIERQSSTSSPTLERELVRFLYSYRRVREVARKMGIYATGLLRTHYSNDPILLTNFRMLYRAVLDCLGHV